MLRFIVTYSLLMLSIAIPPLLVVSIPLAYLWVRRIVRTRRLVINTLETIEAEQRRAAIVKAFR